MKPNFICFSLKKKKKEKKKKQKGKMKNECLKNSLYEVIDIRIGRRGT